MLGSQSSATGFCNLERAPAFAQNTGNGVSSQLGHDRKEVQAAGLGRDVHSVRVKLVFTDCFDVLFGCLRRNRLFASETFDCGCSIFVGLSC